MSYLTGKFLRSCWKDRWVGFVESPDGDVLLLVEGAILPCAEGMEPSDVSFPTAKQELPRPLEAGEEIAYTLMEERFSGKLRAKVWRPIKW